LFRRDKVKWFERSFGTRQDHGTLASSNKSRSGQKCSFSSHPPYNVPSRKRLLLTDVPRRVGQVIEIKGTTSVFRCSIHGLASTFIERSRVLAMRIGGRAGVQRVRVFGTAQLSRNGSPRRNRSKSSGAEHHPRWPHC